MQIEITEEERAFLERVCMRAEMFIRYNINQGSPSTPLVQDKDLECIVNLRYKLKELDSNLMIRDH